MAQNVDKVKCKIPTFSEWTKTYENPKKWSREKSHGKALYIRVQHEGRRKWVKIGHIISDSKWSSGGARRYVHDVEVILDPTFNTRLIEASAMYSDPKEFK